MARQTGIIKLKGTIGDISFYKSQDGHLARQKGGVDKSRIMNEANFQRTRENASEFGRAGKATKALCTAIRPVLRNTKDSRMTSRLMKQMVQVIQADAIGDRGSRNVLDGELRMLQGFEFNLRGKLASSLYAPYISNINRGTGVLEIQFSPFNPFEQIVAPSGTTHVRLYSAGVEVDFETESFVLAQSHSIDIPYDSSLTEALVLTNDLGVVGSTQSLFLLLGIAFNQEFNGNLYPLHSGLYNALSIVLVDSLDSNGD